MPAFEFRFWSRRSDEDVIRGDRLYDIDHPPPFEFNETGRTRSADGDPENKYAPWWDVEVKASVEAESLEAAWHEVKQHFDVVERIS